MYVLFLTGADAARFTEAFCRMLIHSLWQGLLLAVAAGVVMMLTTKRAAAIRYRILSGLFMLFLAACLVTFVKELSTDNGFAQTFQPAAIAGGHLVPYLLQRCIDYASRYSPVIVMLWFVIFCYKSTRMMTAFAYNAGVKSHRIVAPANWTQRVTELAERLGIKRTVSLFESKIVKIPVVLGHLKPVIFMPVGLLNNLPAGEVEAVLLHELAHIRRNDYLVNMMQVIAETVFFFNPALWWLSAMLREERENCCDDVAVRHLKNKKQYIQALLSFKEQAVYASGYTMAFPGSRNQLLKRVTRIVGNRNHALDADGKKFFVISLVTVALLSIAVSRQGTLPIFTKNEIPKTRTAEPAPLIKIAMTNSGTAITGLRHEMVASKIKVKHAKATEQTDNYPRIDVAKTLQVVADSKEKPVYKDYEPAEPAYIPQTIQKDDYLVLQQQAEVLRMQADKDRLQADNDRKQAALDRIQAQKDLEQALKDRAQAMLDRAQADKDRLQAEKDRQEAEKQRLSLLSTN